MRGVLSAMQHDPDANAGDQAVCVVPAQPPHLDRQCRAVLEQRVAGALFCGDNLDVLLALPDESVDLIYFDPPFNTGRVQQRRYLRTERHADGDRAGFGGHRYASRLVGRQAFVDRFADYLAFLEPRIAEAHRVLKESGSLYLHLDYRQVHYARLLLDQVFGEDNFLNEIIWAYDFGGRSRRRWPAKHDNILFCAKRAGRHYFDAEAVDRIPYMAPGLVGPAKAARGKLPTDTWWHTIVSPTGKEKVGYPTQKPLGVLRRIVQASAPPGGLVFDGFAGSGTTGVAACELGRRYVLVDELPEATEIAQHRLRATDAGNRR